MRALEREGAWPEEGEGRLNLAWDLGSERRGLGSGEMPRAPLVPTEKSESETEAKVRGRGCGGRGRAAGGETEGLRSGDGPGSLSDVGPVVEVGPGVRSQETIGGGL